MTQTTKAIVELTRNDDGLWLTVENAGRKATILLDPRGPLMRSILHAWAASQFQQPDPVQVLHDLFEAGDLDYHFYDIHEREGQGWEGPRIVKWGKACADARRLMQDN